MSGGGVSTHDQPQHQEPTAHSPVYPIRPVTILEDPQSFNIKHPLQYTWNLWLKDGSIAANGNARPGRGQTVQVTAGNWKDQLQDIDAISTVEDFWGYFFFCVFSFIPLLY